jgi:hypothetical protein
MLYTSSYQSIGVVRLMQCAYICTKKPEAQKESLRLKMHKLEIELIQSYYEVLMRKEIKHN